LGINLMQGKYSGEKAEKFKGINFRSVALALSVVLILQISTNFLSALYLKTKASQLETQSLELYQELYPEDTRIVNIRAQMENHLKTPGANASENNFIELLAAIAGQLGADMQIQTITFSTGDNGLTLELRASSLAQLDALESALDSMGYPAEITYANQNNQIISGRISILPKPVGV
jgi:general secretion pathway protein L